jgi:eukaryotic-like serine/threonine-protein kinase
VQDRAKILVVADDPQYGHWLRHSLEAAHEGASVVAESCADFERRLASSGSIDHELVLLLLRFSAIDDAPSHGTTWLTRLRDIPGTPPMLVIAEDGDELSAVQSLRMGMADYLPRRLVTAKRLQDSIQLVRKAAPQRRNRDRSAPVATLTTNTLGVPRDLIPRYSLIDKLGESARAVVYLAHSAALNRQVALKVSRVAENEEPSFSHEYAAIGAIRHAAIVDIYDYGLYDGREYIAMEYFPCGDLKARLQNPMSETESLDFLQRIASALAVVHGAGIIHRDLKPPNIMLREDGQIVLIDFGLAKNIGSTTQNTAAGVLRGSPYYMSPEQAQGAELDLRSDLYSLGVIFYEMLVGKKPYLGATAVEVLQQHVSAPVPSLPPELAQHQALLDGLMNKLREDRVASANDLLEGLARAAA